MFDVGRLLVRDAWAKARELLQVVERASEKCGRHQVRRDFLAGDVQRRRQGALWRHEHIRERDLRESEFTDGNGRRDRHGPSGRDVATSCWWGTFF